MTAGLVIDPEFSGLHRRLSKEERALLKTDIEEKGIVSPLVVWKGQGILLDGHNRWEIADELEFGDLQRPIKELAFKSREDAWRWIIKNQLGRRNITPDEASALRGKRYRLEKKTEGAPTGNTNASKQPPQSGEVEQTTAERLGKEYGVSKNTIQRDAEYSEALDTIRDSSAELSALVTQPKAATKREIIAIAEDLKTDPRRVELYLKKASEKPTPKPPKQRTLTAEEKEQKAKKERIAKASRVEHAFLDGIAGMRKIGREGRDEYWATKGQDGDNWTPDIYWNVIKQLTEWMHESFPKYRDKAA